MTSVKPFSDKKNCDEKNKMVLHAHQRSVASATVFLIAISSF